MSTLPLYQIDGWDDNFENFKSRTIDKCQYLNLPNKQGGSGWSNVMGEADGMAIYGVWVSIATMCSRQRRHEVAAGGKLLREGYLTDNGKKDGRRLSARELSNMFRRPLEEIYRCFQVVSSPAVGWLRLAEGEHEYAAGMAKAPEASPEYPLPILTAPPRQPPPILEETLGVSPEHPLPISRPDDDRLIDRNSTLSDESETENKADGERIDGAWSEDGRRVAGGCREDTLLSAAANGSTESRPTVPVLQDGVGDDIQHAEAKRLFGGLAQTVFGKTLRETQWPSDLEHHLDAALPLARESWLLIDWFYRVPEDHPIFNITMRRQSFESVIRNLDEEVQKIKSSRKKIRLNGIVDCGARISESQEWTAARKKAALELYGERELPALFSEMAASARTEIELRIASACAEAPASPALEMTESEVEA